MIETIKQQLNERKYWDVQHEKGMTILTTNEVVSFEVGLPTKIPEHVDETTKYTYKGLLYLERIPSMDQALFLIVFPDLDLIQGAETAMEAIVKGKKALRQHLHYSLEENREEFLNSPYVQHPSQTTEEAKERHLLSMREIYDNEELSTLHLFIQDIDITVEVGRGDR